jgi:DNA-binding NarL/FixJ family response regulator
MGAPPGHAASEHNTVNALVDVAIVDSIRSARESLAAALRGHDFRVHLPEDMAVWLDQLSGVPPVVVVRLPPQALCVPEEVQAIRRRRPGAVVIGLSSVIDDEVCTRALGAGAAAVLGPDAHDSDVAMAIHEALDEHSVLPTEVAMRMAMKTAPHVVVELTRSERDWLIALAHGKSADGVADDAGYSPRHFRRILRSLYGRLGATSMREALVKAAKADLLGPD